MEKLSRVMFLVKLKLLSTDVHRDSLNDFSLLINSAVQLFWYTGCLKENTADKYGHTKRRYN